MKPLLLTLAALCLLAAHPSIDQEQNPSYRYWDLYVESHIYGTLKTPRPYWETPDDSSFVEVSAERDSVWLYQYPEDTLRGRRWYLYCDSAQFAALYEPGMPLVTQEIVADSFWIGYFFERRLKPYVAEYLKTVGVGTIEQDSLGGLLLRIGYGKEREK